MAAILIDVSSSAEEGESVPVFVRVTNTLGYNASFKATIYAVPDLYPDFTIGNIDGVINSGASKTLSTSFTMPDCNTTVFVWVERWDLDHWTYAGSGSKVVSLETVPEPTPTDEELIYANWLRTGGTGTIEEWRALGSPLYYTPPTTTYHLSGYVTPGGYVTPDSGNYAAYSTVTLRAYPLSGYQFVRWGGDASGTSTTFNLYMNSNKHVEAYFEKVPVEPVEEFAGSIARKELEYDGAKGNIPVY